MDFAEYIRQKTAQDIYKEAASKEYRRTSVKDRLEQNQNDRRQTRNRLLNSIRNITNLSPMTPTPIASRDQSKVSKKVMSNNMREKLAKWKAEKEKRKLEEKKKARPTFKVSHVPDKLELPSPPPHFKSKFAPLDHVFAPPKNIKPIEITKLSSSLNKPVERKLPVRDENNKKKTSQTSTTILSKPVEKKLPHWDAKSDNKKKILQITPNTLTEKIVPSEGHPNNQKSKITKTVNGKENKAKVFPSKNLQTANQKKDTSIHKNVISKAVISSSSKDDKKKLGSNMKGLKRAPSTSKPLSSQDRNNKHLKQNIDQIVICESSTDEDEGKNLENTKHEQRSNTKDDKEQIENMEIGSKGRQSSKVTGSDKEVGFTSSLSKKPSIIDGTSGTDEEKSMTEEPLKGKSKGVRGQKRNGAKEIKRLTSSVGETDSSSTVYFSVNLDENVSTSLGQKPKSLENVEHQEKEIMETKGKIVRFDSKDSISSDDVFKTPIRLNNRTGTLMIESEVNISLSKPASTKKYKRTPYKSFPQSEIFYSDDEVCLKSTAVRKSRTSFKTPDKRATPGISDFLTSTSDSGGSFQCVTMRKPHNISGTRSVFMSTSDSGTPGSIGGLKRKSIISVSSQGSPRNAIDITPNAPDIRGRSSRDPCDVEVVEDLRTSKPNEISGSLGTTKQLETSESGVSDSKLSSKIKTSLSSSDSDTSNVKPHESFSTGEAVKTPVKHRRASSVNSAPSSDSETPKSSEISEIFDSPSIKMSLRSRLRKRENSSAQNEPSSLKNSESSGVSGTRKSLRTSTRNRGSSSIKSTNKSSANRKSHIQKSTPSSEPESSDPDGCETKSKPVTTPDAKNPRLSSSNTETPDQKGSVPSAVYVSPFVTISRGKNSARKEYQVRKSTGGTLPGAEAATSPKAGAKYFYGLLNTEIARIEGICHEWNKYKDTDIPEEAHDMIDTAIGQSKLLIAQKFNQFRRLIEECQRGGDERTVTCQDLHGFWDMVFLQVEDVDKRFNNLNKLKENNWREIITEKKVVRTKRQRKTKAKASSRIKEMIDAARRKKGQEQQGTSINDLPVILAEGVKVDESQPSSRPSPSSSLTKPTGSVRRSLRASLLTNQLQQKRRKSSPGLVMMNVSQMIKSNDGLTPCKSILKNNRQSKSEKRITKTVLFKEDLEDEKI